MNYVLDLEIQVKRILNKNFSFQHSTDSDSISDITCGSIYKEFYKKNYLAIQRKSVFL